MLLLRILQAHRDSYRHSLRKVGLDASTPKSFSRSDSSSDSIARPHPALRRITGRLVGFSQIQRVTSRFAGPGNSSSALVVAVTSARVAGYRRPPGETKTANYSSLPMGGERAANGRMRSAHSARRASCTTGMSRSSSSPVTKRCRAISCGCGSTSETSAPFALSCLICLLHSGSRCLRQSSYEKCFGLHGRFAVYTGDRQMVV
jgi:hypothetical protein